MKQQIDDNRCISGFAYGLYLIKERHEISHSPSRDDTHTTSKARIAMQTIHAMKPRKNGMFKAIVKNITNVSTMR
jgi:hypothetical protein